MKQRPFVLAAEGVNKNFAGFQAITDLSFYMDEGELRTVIGPNGAGKTTFLDLITGRTKADTGTITFDDQHELTAMNEYEIYRLGIGASSRHPPFTRIIASSRIYSSHWKVRAGCGSRSSSG
jgi:urea transport system ATP-binding protein